LFSKLRCGGTEEFATWPAKRRRIRSKKEKGRRKEINGELLTTIKKRKKKNKNKKKIRI